VPKPEVSVIVAAYNAMPYLRQCLDSALDQSLSASRYEIIVVDDGSIDGTEDYLREHENRDRVTVIRQQNSGGPASPRNRGLELANGQYVFFLDADDYLGTEALERLLGTARRNDSDVVLGKMVGVGGRMVPETMFRRDQPRTTVFESRVYWALNPLKLFRRGLIEELGLRFDENLPVGQDQPFVAKAYLNAKVISVLASYDCYFARLRDDGGNNTQRAGGATRRLPMLRAMFDLIPRSVPAGMERDLLLRRHFQSEQREFLDHLGRETDPVLQRAAFDEFAGFVRTWCERSVSDPLPAADRLRLELVRRGDLTAAIEMMRFQSTDQPFEVHAEAGRAYAAYPGFRAAGIADHFFDVTDQLAIEHTISDAEWVPDGEFRFNGSIRIDRLHPAESMAQAVLVSRDGTIEFPLETSTVPESDWIRFRASLNPRSFGTNQLIDAGQWDLFMDVTSQGVTRRARIGAKRDPSITLNDSERLVQGSDTGTVRHVQAYFTKPFDNLSFDVGLNRSRVTMQLPVQASARPGSVQISGRLPGVGLGSTAIALAVRRTDQTVITLASRISSIGEFTAALPLRGSGRMSEGPWELTASIPASPRPPEVKPVLVGGTWQTTMFASTPPQRIRVTNRSDSVTIHITVLTPAALLRSLWKRARRILRK